MEYLIKYSFDILTSYLLVLPIVLAASGALYLLFYYSKKGKFYPAMPFLSLGCFIGASLSWLIIFLFM